MLRICRDGGSEIDMQRGVGGEEAGVTGPDGDTVLCPPCGTPEDDPLPERRRARSSAALSDRHEYVLALFKYGLVDSTRDLAMVMNVAESEAEEICGQLVDAGLLDAPGAKSGD